MKMKTFDLIDFRLGRIQLYSIASLPVVFGIEMSNARAIILMLRSFTKTRPQV